MRGARSIRTSRRGKKAPPKKLARIGRVPKEGTAEAAAFKKLVADAVREAVKSVLEPYLPGLAAAGVQPAGVREDGMLEQGKLRYAPGFEELSVRGTHYDLRDRARARLCVQYLVEAKAFDADSARSFVDEIDPYVRRRGGFGVLRDVRLNDYFNDRTGEMRRLKRELIASAGRNGRYFLRVK
jgi:hypothetical protein